MAHHFANDIPSRLSMWQRVRAYAAPPSMIETATARRAVGDWAGACAAARIDVELDLRAVRGRHGTDLVHRLRADLRRLSPDLLRWHMPRIAPRRAAQTRPHPVAGPLRRGRSPTAGPVLRVVLERRVGELRLPPGVRIVAAANPRASAADGWELSPPLANRFVHLHWVHDRDVVVRGLGGVWPRAELPRLVPERLPEAVAFARRAVCGFLEHRPGRFPPLPFRACPDGGDRTGQRATGSGRHLAGRGRATRPGLGISCDAAAGTAVPLCRAENIELVGGGGTDLRSGFAQALRSRPRPDVIVARTDGQTAWPSEQPACRTVVGFFPRPARAVDETDPDHVPDTPPPWARVVTIG